MLSQFKDRVARLNKLGNNNNSSSSNNHSNSNSSSNNSTHSSSSHNRLTKPRTNTNSKTPSPVFSPDSPLPESPRYSDLSAKSRQQIKECMLTPTDKDIEVTSPSSDKAIEAGELVTDSRGRLSFAVSRSNSKVNSRANSKTRNPKTNSRSNSLSCFLSRKNSATNSHNVNESKTPAISGSQVDVEAAIRLLQEVKKNASPEDLAAIREALEPSGDEPTPTPRAGVTRRTSGVGSSFASLMRRRSLVQTPGMATRGSPVEHHRRTWNSWRAPQLSAEDEAKWRAPVKQPSTDQLNALDLADDGRAQTPGSMDYSHLGTYKPGTLMVTNGPPSPAASSVHISRHNHSTTDNEYFPSGDGDITPTRGARSRSRSHTRSKSSTTARTTSPAPAKQRMSMVETRGTAFSDDNIYTSSQQPPPINRSARNAPAFVQEYQAYRPPSPFGNPVEFHTEASEDFPEVYEEPEAYEEKQVCEECEPEQNLHNNVFELAANGSEASDDSTGVHAKSAEYPIYGPRGRPTPRTTDSGYSSLGSLRRVASESQEANTPTTTAASGTSPRSRFGTSRQQTGSFELPIQGPQISEYERTLMTTVPPQKVHARPAPLVIPTADSTSETVLSPRSATSADSPRTRARLQRRRTSQAGPPVVQSCQPVQEMSIPEVPDDVRVNFTQRLSSTPGMGCLTQTYPTKEHESSSDPTSGAAALETLSATPSPPVDFERPPTPPAATRRRSRSLFRRKSEKVAGEEELPSPQVLDLGTIAVALGASPYDPAMFDTPQRKSVASPTHPHQLGQPSRPKSMSMSSDVAAEFARMRSKDRAVGGLELGQEKAHRKPRGDAGEARAARRRPQSFYFDDAPPPVPAIDSVRFPGPRTTPVRQETQPVPAAQHSLDWDSHSLHWSQRRKSIGEGLREHARAQAPQPRARPVSHMPTRDEAAAWGRYSGGLEYEYEGRGYGVGGSAGTRQLHSYATPKSQAWQQNYGVDLSDVPVILQRV